MTALARLLAARIKATGPISVADYMAACLTHPEHGYYTSGRGIGAAGDFTTAPEISQMFGELTALALAQAWLDQGAPAPFALAEAGPGRGTWMADALRATARVPGFHAGAGLHQVEVSPALRAAQAAALAGQPLAQTAQWHDVVEDLPRDRPLLLMANEFLDALPVRQFVRQTEGWSERQVGLAEDGTLRFGLSPPAPRPALADREADTEPGGVVELAPALPAVVGAIAGRIAQAGGLALLVDYGDWRSRGETLQAVAGHAFADPLDAPGQADLTAQVDFEAVAKAARAAGAAVHGPVPQGAFLDRLGIGARAEALARRLPEGPALENHRAATRRLTHPGEMGSLFKVLAVTQPGAPAPPGVSS